MVSKFFLTTSLLLGVVLNLNVLAFAKSDDAPARALNGQPLPKPDRRGIQVQAKMEADALTGKVDLPNLPEFTGKAVFIGGLVHQANKGQHYVEHFKAKEDAKLVLDWYLNTLNMYKWQIMYNDSQSITAKSPTAQCSIFINDTSTHKTAYKSEIEINYFQSQTK
jgi:hypothetical protein